MPASSSRTQDSDQQLASALSSAVTGIVITTTGRSTTTTTAAFVVGIAFSTVIAGSIASILPAASSRRAITATTAAAVAATTAAAVAATTAAAVAATTAAAIAATAAAVATTTATAVATTAAATTRSTTPGFSFVDPKRTAHQFCTLKTFNRCVFGGLIRHLDERKTTLAACIPLEGQRTVRNFTELGKQFNHIFLLSAEGKVADKNAHVLRGPGTKQWTEEAWIIAIGP
jgi:hypothetical protein